MKRFFQRILYRHVMPWVGLIVVKAISSTYRLRIMDPKNEDDTLRRDGSIVYASWHQRFFPGITLFAVRRPIAILISPSRDGEFISRIVNVLGWRAVRGSSSRGGNEGLQKMKDLALDGYRIGHIVDGPKGPFGVVKPGLLRIAQVSGMSIVPTITSSENKWVFRSWDRFHVPKPFSRVIVRFGEPVSVPMEMNDQEFEMKRLNVQDRMKDLYEDTDLIWSDPERIREVFRN